MISSKRNSIRRPSNDLLARIGRDVSKHDCPPQLRHALRALLGQLAVDDLLAFAYLVPTDQAFIANWHHRVITSWIGRLVRGEIKRLMILTPPRQGKSRMVSHLTPAWALGRDPREQIISASYGSSLAQTNSRTAQRVIDCPEYRYAFPRVHLHGANIRTLSGQPLRNVDEWEVLDRDAARRHGGLYKCAGVGGGLTGRGFSLGIVDDPVRDARDADSALVRDRHWEWYLQVFRTRALGPAARILWIMTRWHHDDLGGRVLEAEGRVEDGGAWHVLSLPAILDDESKQHADDPREYGEALWPGPPYYYNLDYLEDLRSSAEIGLSKRAWEALYQQRPDAAEGNVWRHDYFRHITETTWHVDELLPVFTDSAGARIRGIDLQRYATVDVALGHKDGDWTAVGVWGLDIESRRVYLLHVWRARAGAPETLAKLRQVCGDGDGGWRVPRVYIEAVQYQAGLVQIAREQGIPAYEIRPDRDKLARVRAVEFWGEQGRILHRDDAPWTRALELELTSFRGHRDDTDDQVDMWSYGVQVAIDTCKIGAGAPDAGWVSRSPSRRDSGVARRGKR